MRVNVARAVAALAVCFVLAGCKATHRADKVGSRLERKGDEIVIAGQFFHTGAPVVLWTDPGGYDAYRVERRFAPWERASFEKTAEEAAENKRLKRNGTEVDAPARYGIRFAPTTRSTTQTAATQAIPDSTTEPATRSTSRPGRRRGRPTEGGEKLTKEQLQQVR